jgi:hypothetical protein
MQRWSEQFAIKHAEFHQGILYFKRHSNIWTTLAEADGAFTQLEGGEVTISARRSISGCAACARRTASIHKDLMLRMERAFKRSGLLNLVQMSTDESLWQRVMKCRTEEINEHLPFYWCVSSSIYRPLFKFDNL